MRRLALFLALLLGAATAASAQPYVTTIAPTVITDTSATLQAVVDPNGATTTAYVEWGLTPSYGNFLPNLSVGSTVSDTLYAVAVPSLSCGTSYHYRGVGTNSAGTRMGADIGFITLACGGTPPPPSPPPPTTTGTITLLWDPNQEPDVIGYLVSSGQGPTAYTSTVDVGSTTSALVTIANTSVSWCFGVRAYNTSGLVSSYSTQACTVPSSGSGAPAVGRNKA